MDTAHPGFARTFYLEFGYRAEETLISPQNRLAWRFRLVACCLVLTAISFVQQPGRIVSDTKLDLAISPISFLQRVLQLWNPQSAFGEVQNQAYGYLFPMGPFFALGKVARIDPWVVQRLWWALLLCVAFLGIVKLAKELGIGSKNARILTGFAFALSPHLLTVIGPSSIEVWPTAVAPWVLVPLVIGVQRGNPKKYAALSALAVFCAGGVNATATFAVLPLGVLWLIMATPGHRRRHLFIWWPAFVLLGTFWWLVPLFLLGGYSPPFLDYIEGASATTSVATVFDAMRGTTNWIPYISNNSNAGYALISQPVLIADSVVIMALGVVGIARSSTPHRKFLLAGLLLGLLMVTAGHTGSIQGIRALSLQDALDGVFAPLRNSHKFDVVLRIPLVIGFGHLLSRLSMRNQAKESNQPVAVLGFGILAVIAVIGGAAPAWTGQLADKGSFTEIPQYWKQTAKWLQNYPNATALLEPSSAFPDYAWGRTNDEPMQVLASSPWAVRNSIPLADTGNIRFLDSLTAELGTGVPAAGLATTLRRAGVRFVVLRNDLDPQVSGPNAEATFRTLDFSQNIRLAAEFGPMVGSGAQIASQHVFGDAGWHSQHHAIEIYEVSDVSNSREQAAYGTPTVVGGAESLTRLDRLGLIGNASVILAADQPKGMKPSSIILTDSNRRREVAFGSVIHNQSSSLAPSDKYSRDRRVHDYVQNSQDQWLATPRLMGAKSLTASSSMSDSSAPGGPMQDAQPWSAFDDNPRTAWSAQTNSGWIQLEFAKTRNVGTITIRSNGAPGVKQTFRIQTENGPVEIETVGKAPRSVRVGSVSGIQIRGKAPEGSTLSIATIGGPKLRVARPIKLPELRSGWEAPNVIVLGDAESGRPGCLRVEGIDRCRSIEDWGEDSVLVDRTYTNPHATKYELDMKVAPIAGNAFADLMQRGGGRVVHASSTVNRDVRSAVDRSIDGMEATGWISREGDRDPTLTVKWDKQQKVDKIHLLTADTLPASAPTSAVLDFDNGAQRQVKLKDGSARFEAVKSKGVAIHLTAAKPSVSYDAFQIGESLPVGVSEFYFGESGNAAESRAASPMMLPCGSGPTLAIDGKKYQTSVSVERSKLAEGGHQNVSLCGGKHIRIASGETRITIRASKLFRPTTTVFRSDASPIAIANAVPRDDLSAAHRELGVSDGGPSAIVQTDENFNKGWTAHLNGRKLRPIVMNGWQQGWIVPAGATGTIDASYAPNRIYHAGLIVGAGLVAILLLLATWRWGDMPVLNQSRVRRRRLISLIVAIALLLLVGGVWFTVVAEAGMLLALVSKNRQSIVDLTLYGALLAAATAYVIRPWGSSSGWAGTLMWPQLCVALVLGLLVGVVFFDRQDFSRNDGNSTSR